MTIQWINSFLQVRARVHHDFRRPAHFAGAETLDASKHRKMTTRLTQNFIAAFFRGAPGIDDRLVSGGARAKARLVTSVSVDCESLAGGARGAFFLSVHRTAPSYARA